MTEAIETATPAETMTNPDVYNMIDVRGLFKRYPDQRRPALEELTLAVPQGQILGLIGPNGAGKTTVLRILATLISPDKGDAYIAGQSVRKQPQAVRHLIGFMPDNYGLYEDMQVSEYLEFFAACYGVQGKRRNRLVRELLELVDLSEYRKENLRTLSRGMRQRLCLAHTLVHDPKVLLLDEPASGLDPRARIELRELLRELSRMGKTIIISSHVLSEIQLMCDMLGLMALGKLVNYGPTEKVINQIEHLPRRGVSMRVLSQDDLKRAVKLAEAFPQTVKGSLRLDEAGLNIEALLDGDDQISAEFLSTITGAGIKVAQYGQSTALLEELFLRD